MVLFFLGEFLFLTIPHLVWLRVAGPHLETFLKMTSHLTRLKSNHTKLYDLESRSFVSWLKSRYSKSWFLLVNCYVKLGLQITSSVLFLVATAVVYNVTDSHLRGSYYDCTLDREVYARPWFEQFELFCQEPNTTASSNHFSERFCLNETVVSVPCFVSLSALFYPLWIISLACLGLAFVATLVGIFWSAFRAFTDVLGKAVFVSCTALALIRRFTNLSRSPE